MQFSTSLLVGLAQHMNLTSSAVVHAAAAMAAKQAAMPTFEDGMLISIAALRRPDCRRFATARPAEGATVIAHAIEQLSTWWQPTVPCQLPEAVHDVKKAQHAVQVCM